LAWLVCATFAIAISGSLHAADDASAATAIRGFSAEITAVGGAYGQALLAAANDRTQVKLDQVRLRYVDCTLKLHHLNRSVAELKFEGDEGSDLKTAYQKWLETQIDNMQTLGLDYIEVVEVDKLTPNERREKLIQLSNLQTEIEKPFGERLDAALRAYEEK
jgi:hypothetical protein